MKYFLTFITLFLCLGCNQTDTSVVLTKEHLFTGGIEGPAWGPDGYLYAVNFDREHTIGKISTDGKCELFMDLPEGSTGNGIRFNSKGEMLIADYTGHNVLKVNMETMKVSVFAHDSSMNQPNDLAIAPNGILFASDPNWNENTGKLWRINTTGEISLLEEDMGTTNGIEVNLDGTILYVNESVQRKVWAYKLDKDGNISDKKLLIKFNDFGLDGMRCDTEGNLFITRYGKGTVVVVSPSGEIIREIRLYGKNPTNIAFGEKNGTTCFVTIQDKGNIETFKTQYPGRGF